MFRKIGGRIIPILREGNVHRALPKVGAKIADVRALRHRAKNFITGGSFVGGVGPKLMRAKASKLGKEADRIIKAGLRGLRKYVKK